MEKIYEIHIVRGTDCIWIKSDKKVLLNPESTEVSRIKEIDINSDMPGIDIIIK